MVRILKIVLHNEYCVIFFFEQSLFVGGILRFRLPKNYECKLIYIVFLGVLIPRSNPVVGKFPRFCMEYEDYPSGCGDDGVCATASQRSQRCVNLVVTHCGKPLVI